MSNRNEDEPSLLLAVEDEEIFREMIRLHFEQPREFIFAVSFAERLSEAVAKIESERFDVILLDLELPDSIGFETLERVKQATQNLIPIVVWTGSVSAELEQEAIRRGATDFLPKTADIYMIAKILNYAARRKRTKVFWIEESLRWQQEAQRVRAELESLKDEISRKKIKIAGIDKLDMAISRIDSLTKIASSSR